jgi:hypothetical protein
LTTIDLALGGIIEIRTKLGECLELAELGQVELGRSCYLLNRPWSERQIPRGTPKDQREIAGRMP